MWLDLVQVSERAYVLLKKGVLLNVGCMIRFDDGTTVGVHTPQKGRGGNKLRCFVSEGGHNRCESSSQCE